jgi:small-conductance mechanosensitive channel
VIVPNSKLVGEYVINWSHFRERSRFKVPVGVAYGSDVELVRKLLLESLDGCEKILHRPKPFVRFAGFGDSSLDFELHFWSRELMRIENVKSDIRFEIYRLFAEHSIQIPFPQRDVWIKKPE